MCKIAFVAFHPTVPYDRRVEAVARVLQRGWEMGNKDGVGFVTWGKDLSPIVSKALELKDLRKPKEMGCFTLLHDRAATTPKTLENTHPIEMDGAYLVHNGIVSPTRGFEDKYTKMCATTCDSENILAAYIAEGRDLGKAMKHISGMANVMLWDSKRNVLSIYVDSADFNVYRQAGVFYITQTAEQTRGVVFGGLGWPYEFDKLEDDKIYEIPLEADEVNWLEVIESARKNAVDHRRIWESDSRYRDHGGYYENGEFFRWGTDPTPHSGVSDPKGTKAKGSTTPTPTGQQSTQATHGVPLTIRQLLKMRAAEKEDAEKVAKQSDGVYIPRNLTKRNLKHLRKALGVDDTISNEELKLLVEYYGGLLTTPLDEDDTKEVN